MGKCLAQDFQKAREVFEEVEESLQFRLTKLMWDGLEEELRLTNHAQPAIFAHSVAALEVLRHEIGLDFATAADDKFRAAAGHSLGEYAAMVAAGLISLRDGAQILQARSSAMSEIQVARAPNDIDAAFMVSLMPCNEETARNVCEAAGCEVASINSAKVAVISGPPAAIQQALQVCKSVHSQCTVSAQSVQSQCAVSAHH